MGLLTASPEIDTSNRSNSRHEHFEFFTLSECDKGTATCVEHQYCVICGYKVCMRRWCEGQYIYISWYYKIAPYYVYRPIVLLCFQLVEPTQETVLPNARDYTSTVFNYIQCRAQYNGQSPVKIRTSESHDR